MKFHPIIAVILGLIITFLIAFGFLYFNLGYFSLLIALFLSGAFAASFSKTNKLTISFSIGLIVAIYVLLATLSQGIALTNTWQLILMPISSGLGGWIYLKINKN